VPLWARRAGQWIGNTVTARPLERPAVISPGPASADTTAAAAGVALIPSGRFVIRFSAMQVRGVVTVSFTDDPRVLARALDGHATFTAAEDDLTIDNRGSTADYIIEIPRLARRVELHVAGRRLISVQQGRIMATSGVEPVGDQFRLRLDSPR
jgi:hypothetical protein